MARSGQHVGQPDGVVEVVADAPFRPVRRRQPEQVLHAQGHAHEQVVLHLGDRDELVRLADAGGQQVAVEHVAAAGHVVQAQRRQRGIDELDPELAQHVGRLEVGRHGLGRRVHAGVGGDQGRVGAGAQQAQHGAHHLLVHQLLAPAVVAGGVRVHHVELDDDAARAFQPAPQERGQRLRDAPPASGRSPPARRGGRSARRVRCIARSSSLLQPRYLTLRDLLGGGGIPIGAGSRGPRRPVGLHGTGELALEGKVADRRVDHVRQDHRQPDDPDRRAQDLGQQDRRTRQDRKPQCRDRRTAPTTGACPGSS